MQTQEIRVELIHTKERNLLVLLFLAIGMSIATLCTNAQAFEEVSEMWALPINVEAVESETEVELKVFDDSSEVDKKEKIKDLLLLCCFEAGAMLITGGAISNFNGTFIAIGGVIFGLSMAAIYDLFPRSKGR